MKHDALLVALGELVHKEISAGQLLQRVVRVIASILGADRGTIYLLNESGDELVSVAAQLPEIEEIRVPMGQGIAGYVAQTGRFVNIPYCESDIRFWGEVDQRTGYTTRSMLTGPLKDAEGKLIGVVQVLNKHQGMFTDQDRESMEVLASQVAVLLAQTTIGPSADKLSHLLGPGPSGDPGRRRGSELPLGDRINGVIGSGQAMRKVFRSIFRVAPTEANVLLRGESGTGKTLVARALHHNSLRHQGPFVHVNCTTLPEGLMENELFGHEKGAYTGAHASKEGKVDAAGGGTLFLDEIGDLPLSVQGTLLTLIQERTYYRVGGTRPLSADIRIIAATNRDLESAVRQGGFREDLYYRLNVVQILIPALRERGREDLLHLLRHFIEKAARRHHRPVPRIRQDALGVLLNYHWPGNVRELENCVESAVIFADETITPSTLALPRANATMELQAVDLAADLAALRAETSAHKALLAVAEGPEDPFVDEPTLRELERRYIRVLLKRHDGNRSACARVLDIGRNTLLRKIKEYGLE